MTTDKGRTLFETTLSSLTNSKVVFKEIDLTWTSNSSIAGVEVTTSSRRIAIEKVEFHESLLQFIGNGLKFRAVELVKPDVSFELATKRSSQSGFFVPFQKLVITNGQILVLANGEQNYKLSDINTSFRLSQRNLQSADITLNALSGRKSGNLKAHYKLEDGTYSLSANVNKFPLAGLDELVTLFYPQHKGLLRSSIGNQVDAYIKLKIGEQSFEAISNVESEFFNASVNTNKQQNPINVNWQISPTLAAFFYPKELLKQRALFSVNINNLNIPHAGKVLDFRKSAFDLEIASEKLDFGELYFDHFSLNLVTSNLMKKLSISGPFYARCPYGKLAAHISGSIFSPFQEVGVDLDLESQQAEFTPKHLPEILFNKISLHANGKDKNNIELRLNAIAEDKADSSWLGDKLKLHANSNFVFSNSDINFKNTVIDITGDSLQAHIIGDYINNNIEITKPGVLQYTLTPEQSKNILENSQLALLSPAMLDCLIPKQVLNLDKLSTFTAIVKSMTPIKIQVDQSDPLTIEQFNSEIEAQVPVLDFSVNSMLTMQDNSTIEIIAHHMSPHKTKVDVKTVNANSQLLLPIMHKLTIPDLLIGETFFIKFPNHLQESASRKL